ncbi:MAG: TolC family protein [Planctomycetota bacterium]
MQNYKKLFLFFLCEFFCIIFFAQETPKKDPEDPKKSTESSRVSGAKTPIQFNILEQLEKDMRDFKIQEWVPQSMEAKRISLQDCLSLALIHNLDLRVESHNPEIVKEDIQIARSRFDTVFFSELNASESTRETGSTLEGSETHNIKYEVGVKKNTLTGGTLELSLATNRRSTNSSFASLDPSWGSGLTLSLTQPLLKGLGWETNQINIRLKEKEVDLAYLAFYKKVILLVQQVKKTYWDLVFSIADLKVKQISLELANRLVVINNAKFEAGVIAKIEIIQAETSVAERKESVIVAQSAVEDQEEALKKLIHPNNELFLYQLALRPTDNPIFQKETVDIQEATKKALLNRSELKQIDIQLNQLRLSLQQSENNLMPSLNFVGSIGLSGLQGNFANSLDSTFSGDQYEWVTGFVFEVPLGNREARSRYRQILIQQKQKKDQYLFQVTEIKFEISRLCRAIRTLESSIYATLESTKLAKEQLIAEEQRFNVGLSTNFRVADVQEDYVTALSRELKAIIEYKKALVDLDAAQSTLLMNSGIQFEPSK